MAGIAHQPVLTMTSLQMINLTSLIDDAKCLDIYQFSSTPQSCGRGRQDWISLTMRRSPRVNQEVLLRATFLG
jgi:hypothetical protein